MVAVDNYYTPLGLKPLGRKFKKKNNKVNMGGSQRSGPCFSLSRTISGFLGNFCVLMIARGKES